MVGVAAAVATADTGAEVKGEQEPDREPELAEPELAESELAEPELAEPELAEPEPPKPEPWCAGRSLPVRPAPWTCERSGPPPVRPSPAATAPMSGSPGLRWSPASSAVAVTSTGRACRRAPAATPGSRRAPGNRCRGTRPPLGVLVADDGAIYRLDRNYLVGSNSTRDPTVGGGLARPLVLTGSDISGSHAELRLTDWDLTVVDRGSATGTSIYEPGATEWARLRPYEPRVVSPGTHMAFGQRVVTYLSPWVPSA